MLYASLRFWPAASTPLRYGTRCDTNVLVSAFTARGLSADVFRLVLTEHELLVGEVVLAEFRRVMRDRMLVPAEDIKEAEAPLREQTIIPWPKKPSSIEIRNPDDQWVLASAMEGAADILVTGDKDLLILTSGAPLLILSPRSFWELARRGVQPQPHL